MLKITNFLLCGIILIPVAGCQTARSVTDNIVKWRPSFHKNEQVTEASVEDEGLLAEDESGKEENSDDLLPLKTASLTKTKPTSETEKKKPAVSAKTALLTEDVPASAKQQNALSAFEQFQKSLTQKKQVENQLPEPPQPQSQEAKQEISPEDPVARLLIQEEKATGIDKAFVDTEKLSASIKVILAEEALEPNPFEETAKTSDAIAEEVTTVEVADVVVEENPFAEEAKKLTEETENVDERIASIPDPEAHLISPSQPSPVVNVEAFPWAAAMVKQVSASKKMLTEQVNLLSQSATPEKNIEKKTDNNAVVKTNDQPREFIVSQEILENLERALGDESWRAAGRVTLSSLDAQVTDETLNKISELVHSDHANVRLRGLRLAVEQGEPSAEIIDLVKPLLKDEDDVVKVHTASAMSHWKQSSGEIIDVLASVLAGENSNARQVAAMYLGEMSSEKEKIVPVLKTNLLSAQGMPALHIAESLLKLEPTDVNAVLRLTELMRDQNAEVRWLAAYALGSTQGELQPYAVEALRGGLRDVDAQVSATSALALGGIGNSSQVAVAELNFLTEHGEPSVKDAAKIALDCIQ